MPVISCKTFGNDDETPGCKAIESIEETSGCSGNIGKVISKVIDSSESDISLELCITDNASVAIDEVNEGVTYSQNVNLYLSAIGDFPGSIRNAIGVNIKGDGSAILGDDTIGQLPICNNNMVSDVYCIDRKNISSIKLCVGNDENKIMCKEIEREDESNILYFNNENKEIPVTTQSSDSVKKVYKCTSEGNKRCTVIHKESIVIQNEGFLTCNAIEGCEFKAPNETKKIIYDRMTTNDCLPASKVCKITEDESEDGYLYKCIYNDNKVECSLIENVGYYVDDDDLYTCTNKNELNEQKIEANVVKCKKSTKSPIYVEGENICTTDNIGKIVFKKDQNIDSDEGLQESDTGKYVICTGDNSIEDISEEGKKYIIDKNSSDNTYGLGEDQYTIIEITPINSVIVKNGIIKLI